MPLSDRQTTIIFLDAPQGSGKKSNLENCYFLSERKNNRKPNPLIKTMVHRSNIHYSEIYQK